VLCLLSEGIFLWIQTYSCSSGRGFAGDGKFAGLENFIFSGIIHLDAVREECQVNARARESQKRATSKLRIRRDEYASAKREVFIFSNESPPQKE
jgi:hypothetical protein